MSWLRRLSRDRSKNDPDAYIPQPVEQPSQSRDMSAQRPYTSEDYAPIDNSRVPTKDSQYPAPTNSKMQRLSDREQKHWSMPPQGGSDGPAPVGNGRPASDGDGGMLAADLVEPTPDILTRAFNEALRPYSDRLSQMQAELDHAHHQIQELEAEKAAIHNWVDKRGLRPDLPADLSNYFSASPVAAGTLSAQLERKMTMLNFSLHQLGDVLPKPPPTSTVTSALSALLPSITQLGSLPGGPSCAFESLIKLAGNLNSHNTGDESEGDRAAIAAFYGDLDDAMVRVIGRRIVGISEGEEWDVGRDLRRLEKTGAFLRKEMGVKNYFVRSQETMRGEGRMRPPAQGPVPGQHGGAQPDPLARYSSDSR